jgi:hypothetical protein
MDITDNYYDSQEIDRILLLADNLPLAIDLIAHLVDHEGVKSVLIRWQTEKTSLFSDSHDRRSSLDSSIFLSLSSPRVNSMPNSVDLLGLLAIMPDGLSDVELLQSKLQIDDILGCKATLLRTSLAYADDQKRLRALGPVRDYMEKFHPPMPHLVQALLRNFQELLRVYEIYLGTLSSAGLVARIRANFSNIQTILLRGLHSENPDLTNTIHGIVSFNRFGVNAGQPQVALLDRIPDVLPDPVDHRLEAYYIVEVFSTWRHHAIPDPDALVDKVLEHFSYFDDPDIKCKFLNQLFVWCVKLSNKSSARFYVSIGSYYLF